MAPGLARVALASASGTEPTASTLVRALSHLDAALAASIFRPGIGFGGRARVDAVAGAELLLDVVRRGELDGQPVDGPTLADALHQLLPLCPPAWTTRSAPSPSARPGAVPRWIARRSTMWPSRRR